MRKRIFLNKAGYHSVAAIYAEVKKGSYTLKMADCDRTVSFEIDGYDAESKVNSLRKVDLLINTLVEFRAALVKDFARKRD